MIDTLRSILEVTAVGFKDIFHIFLGIQIDIGKEGALNLNLDFMSLFEGVMDILQRKIYVCNLARFKRLGI